MNRKKLTLGERIADRMIELGLNNSELCKLTDLKPTTLSEIINGSRKNPTAKQLVSLSKGLHISVDYILGLADDPSNDEEMKQKVIETGLPSSIIAVLNTIINCENYSCVKEIAESFLTSPGIYKFFKQFLRYCNIVNDRDEKNYYMYSSDDIFYENSDDFDGKVRLEFDSDSKGIFTISKEYRIEVAKLQIMDTIEEIRRTSKRQYLLNKERLVYEKNAIHVLDDIPERIESIPDEFQSDYYTKDYIRDLHDKAVFAGDERIKELEKEIRMFEKLSKNFYDELENIDK